MPRILVIEDHPLVRDGIAHTLRQHDPTATIVPAKDHQEALALLEAAADFDLALVDLMLPDASGFSLLSVIRKRYPLITILVLSAKDDPPSIKRALRNGASGFVSKAASTGELVRAVTQILSGVGYESTIPTTEEPERGSSPSTPRSREGPTLTPAQARVFELVQAGKSNREISEALQISEGTAKLHVSAIFRAYGVSSRAQLLASYPRAGKKRSV